jgi:ParB family chromosome partitioning protein
MDFARELKRLHEEGWTFKQIAQVACKSENYVRDYIRLVDQGEERLIQGVETGIFPIQFAMNVASSEDSQMQHILMDAFDQQLITTRDFAQARKILSRRAMASADKKVLPG